MMKNSYFWVGKLEKLLIKAENGEQSGSEYIVAAFPHRTETS